MTLNDPLEPERTQLQYLHDLISDRLRVRSQSLEFYRARHYTYQGAAVSLSALITILAGLNLGFLPAKASIPLSPILNDIVLILGAVSTVIAAFGAFFSPQQSWYLNAEVRAALRALEAKLDFAERAPKFKENETAILTEIFAEYQAILMSYNQKWQDLRQKSK